MEERVIKKNQTSSGGAPGAFDGENRELKENQSRIKQKKLNK